MECIDFDIYASSHYDGRLSKKESENFQKHIDLCEDCRIKYKNLKVIVETINEIPEVELPKDFNIELREKLNNENKKKNRIKNIISNRWRFIGGIAATLLILVISIPMANKVLNIYPKNMYLSDGQIENRSNIGYSDMEGAGEIYSYELDEATDSGGALPREISDDILLQENDSAEMNQSKTFESRKIIEKGYIHLEVEDFDIIHEKIISIVNEYNGYIQHNNVYNQFLDDRDINNILKSANMELRIPNDSFTEVFQLLKELGRVVEENTSAEDISDHYMDIDNQKINLQLQEEHLREILQKADNVEDLLQVENELNRIRTEIDRLTGILNNYDKLVSMSTINLYIREVDDIKTSLLNIDDNLWTKSKNSFINSINSMVLIFEKLFVGFFGILPPLIILTVIILPLGYLIYGKFKKKKI